MFNVLCEQYDRTPLYVASQMSHGEVVELLLSRGADAALADVSGTTPYSVCTRQSLKLKLKNAVVSKRCMSDCCYYSSFFTERAVVDLPAACGIPYVSGPLSVPETPQPLSTRKFSGKSVRDARLISIYHAIFVKSVQ